MHGKDFRAILDRKDIDAVVIATPDHWHAIQMISACKAGKDVYVEKPLSMTIVEGRAMVEAAAEVLPDRAGGHAPAFVPAVCHLPSWFTRRDRQGHGGAGRLRQQHGARWHRPCSESEPPADLDWDLWLGPRPARPFQSTIMPYKFRWWNLYSSQIANWGVHYFDLIRWLTGELRRHRCRPMGGGSPSMTIARFRIPPRRSLSMPRECCSLSVYEATCQPVLRPRPEIELHGTLGYGLLSR